MKRCELLLVVGLCLLLIPDVQSQQKTQIVDLDTNLFPLIKFKVQFPGRNEIKRYVNSSNTFVSESGTPRQFTIDCPIDQISFAIILDKSLSMAFKPNDHSQYPPPDPDSVRWRSSKNAIKIFANNLVPPDSACLISFSRIPTLGQDFTDDGTLIAQAVDTISLEEATGTWRACEMALNLLRNRAGRRVIILLNDGGENVAGPFGYPRESSITSSAIANNVVVYSIGLGEFTGTDALQRLSQATGGKFFLSADGSDLTSIYSDIIASITAIPCDVEYETEHFCPDGSKRDIHIESLVNTDVFKADTFYYSPFNLESTTITTHNPSIVFPNQEFEVSMEFETYLRPDEPTDFSASFTYDQTAVEFLRLETDSSIFVEEPPTAQSTANGVLEIKGHTDTYTPQNKFLFTLHFKAKEIKSAKVVEFRWLDVNIVRKCNTVSDGILFSFAVDGLCDKIVRRRTQPALQSVFPNPAGNATTILFKVDSEDVGHISLIVTDQNGELVERLLDGLPVQGETTVLWNCSQIPSGVYWIELRQGGIVESKKLVVTH